MQITGASYTAVNRRITEGRRALRKLEHQRENTELADAVATLVAVSSSKPANALASLEPAEVRTPSRR
jgi:hypothetical protein